jgi:hypothetical protein
LGKALYEGILVDVAFAGFFLAKVPMSRLLEFPCDANAIPTLVAGKAEFPR